MRTPIAPRAAIFDVEGTLVDCVSATLESWRETLLEAKYAFTLQDLQPYSGMDGTWMLEKLLPQESDEIRKALIQRQGERYRDEFIHHTRPFAGVNELFRRLKEANVPIGLATTCKPDELAIYDQQLRILDLIAAAICGEAVKHGKPDPGLFRLCLTALKVPAGVTIAVGDTPFDAMAASRVGMRRVGVLTGGFSVVALRDAGHEQVFQEVSHVGQLWGFPVISLP